MLSDAFDHEPHGCPESEGRERDDEPEEQPHSSLGKAITHGRLVRSLMQRFGQRPAQPFSGVLLGTEVGIVEVEAAPGAMTGHFQMQPVGPAIDICPSVTTRRTGSCILRVDRGHVANRRAPPRVVGSPGAGPGLRVMRPPSSTDLAVREVVQQEPSLYGPVADTHHVWGESPETWFVEVRPFNPRAASMDLAFDGHDLLNVNVGRTWFGIVPFRDDSLDHLRHIVRAVLAGRIEEARTWGEGFARLYTDAGTAHVGHVHLPWPWRWRPVRRYEPYGEPAQPGEA